MLGPRMENLGTAKGLEKLVCQMWIGSFCQSMEAWRVIRSMKRSKSNPKLVLLKGSHDHAHSAFSAQKEKSDSEPSQPPTQADNFPFVHHLSFDFAIVFLSWFHFTNLLDLSPSAPRANSQTTSYSLRYQTRGFFYSILCLARYQRYNTSSLPFRRNDLRQSQVVQMVTYLLFHAIRWKGWCVVANKSPVRGKRPRWQSGSWNWVNDAFFELLDAFWMFYSSW